MTNEHKRRSIEATMPEISDAERNLIEKIDRDPEKTFRELEERSYKIPGRPPRIPRGDYE